MKIIKFAFAVLLCTSIISCSSDDDNNTTDLTGQTGTLALKFDNGVGDQDFIFGVTYNKSNGESYQLETLKYIISNIRVKDAEGNTFTYPLENNAFIIDESNGNNAGEIFVTLDNVDAADYTEITFGIGIDQERFAMGAEGQGDFLVEAEAAGMMWSWATGYKFTRFDGTFSTGELVDEPLNIHMGSVGTSLDNYREVTLSFPNTVRVRETASPEVHIKADFAKVFDGETSVNFADGYGQVHTSSETTPVIANNLPGMFEVHHVHNN
ncbi:MbnP family protein [Mangrovimonas xylaniphaga]|uniref:MbnP family protein n=1 Tax=Mangrovimonas xylaniphaga TaxID=1645915 RepID=UPI0006B4C89B|nr:MbnP family protein [Mangrovimonas xylaniphaga]